MKILVMSTTGHPEANLESARHFMNHNSMIDKIMILSSAAMKQQGKTELLQQSLEQICNIPLEILDIPNQWEESNMLALQNMLLEWINTHSSQDRFIFNVTGGTKLMSIVLDRTSQLLGLNRVECFYQSRDHKIVWYQRKTDQRIYPIHSHLDLQQRVNARGYQIKDLQAITDVSLVELKYAQTLIKKMHVDFHKGRQFCSLMNKLATLSDQQDCLSIQRITIPLVQAEEIYALVEAHQEHFFQFDIASRTLTFKDKISRDFVKGGWLEVYAGYECYKALISVDHQAELAINVTLQKNNTPNEMDVMFIYQAYLYCVECKTAKSMAAENAKDVLYKLSALNDFGGLNQKRAVVSLYSLKEYNLTRAVNADIQVFQEHEILNLSQHLQQWLLSHRSE